MVQATLYNLYSFNNGSVPQPGLYDAQLINDSRINKTDLISICRFLGLWQMHF